MKISLSIVSILAMDLALSSAIAQTAPETLNAAGSRDMDLSLLLFVVATVLFIVYSRKKNTVDWLSKIGDISIPGGARGKAIVAIVFLAAIVLLYKFSLEFRLFFPVFLIWGGVLGAVMIYFSSKARKQTALIQRVRQDHERFQLSHQFFGSNDDTGLLFDANRFELALYSNRGRKVGTFTHRDLIRSEIVEDGGSVSSTNRGSQLAGVVVGNVLLGGVGMIVGGLSGTKKSQQTVSKVSVDVTVKNANEPLWSVVLLDLKKPSLRSSTQVTNALKAAKDIHAMLSVFIRKADDEDKSAAPIQTSTPIATTPVTPRLSPMEASAFTEELAKLAKLKEQGVLDDSEFVEMKKAVLERAKRHLAR